MQNRKGWEDINTLQIGQARNQGVSKTQAEALVIPELPEKTKRKHGERRAVRPPGQIIGNWRVDA